MRKGNMTMLASVLAIALVALGVGMGTMAYFNDVAVATGNTFTAGHLDIKLYDGSTWTSNPIAGFFDSPDAWAPGEEFTRKLYFRNDGNVPVQVVLLNFKNYQWTVALSFRDVIEITSFREHYDELNYVDYGWGTSVGGEDGKITLNELMNTPNDPGTVGDCDGILYADYMGDDNLCTEEHLGSHCVLGGTYLAPGQVGWLEITFKFSSTADSTYEGATCSFDLQMSFIQGPDSGICRHEMPGFKD